MSEATKTHSTDLQVVRETIESLAVAFILALLFKAFIAEAFVIPTGSMAPTLMGAHKDVRCEECGCQYQCGASNEFNDVGARRKTMVIGTTCPLCRKPQIANPFVDSNDATFSGDRILVSKLAYAWAEPRRWDVIVFKFIQEARLNYIKRCIGRPNETIRIQEGNIFVRKNPESKDANAANGTFEIARKPPHVINAMLQPLSDTKYLPKTLIKAGLPSAWQPFPANESNWLVEQTEKNWSASISKVPTGKTHWLRYYHHVVDPLSWESVETTGKLPAPIPPQSSRLVTDFTAYNASYSSDGGVERENFQDDALNLIRRANRFGFASNRPLENDGIHWTGDLAAEFEITTDRDTQTIALLLVEAGVEHECRIDLKTGQATMTVTLNGKPIDAFEQTGGALASKATATTRVRAGGKHRLRFANVDDSLVLWVDGQPLKWSPSGNLQTESYLTLANRIPKSSPTNPLDAAPMAIGVEGGGATLSRARAFRDIYYIAHGNGNENLGLGLFDYPDVIGALSQSSSIDNIEKYSKELHSSTAEALSKKISREGLYRNAILSDANAWACSPMAKNRQTREFTMEKDWYFPMGDNSAASSDARSWNEHHSPERLFIGRAVMVFWPHYWNAPVPFLPNVQRMGLIR
jgi:signal peptidase I